MRILLAALLLATSVNAATLDGALQGPSGPVNLRLTQDACTEPKVLQFLQTTAVPLMRAGTVAWQGKTYNMCWTLAPDDGVVIVVDETGDYGTVPLQAFTRQGV